MSGGGNVGPVATASCGLTFPCPDDLESKLEVVTSSGYDFMAVPIVHPRYLWHFLILTRTNLDASQHIQMDFVRPWLFFKFLKAWSMYQQVPSRAFSRFLGRCSRSEDPDAELRFYQVRPLTHIWWLEHPHHGNYLQGSQPGKQRSQR